MFRVRVRETQDSSDSSTPPPYQPAPSKRHLMPFLHRGNKKRLYVMLFTHTSVDTYHWALAIGPKNDGTQTRGSEPQGRVYHVVSTYAVPNEADMTGEDETDFQDRLMNSGAPGTRVVARMVVGKILHLDIVKDALRGAPREQVDSGGNCRRWVGDALKAVAEADCMGNSVDLSDWQPIEDFMMQYARRRREVGCWSAEAIATCNMMTRTWDI